MSRRPLSRTLLAVPLAALLIGGAAPALAAPVEAGIAPAGHYVCVFGSRDPDGTHRDGVCVWTP